MIKSRQLKIVLTAMFEEPVTSVAIIAYSSVGLATLTVSGWVVARAAKAEFNEYIRKSNT